MSPTNIPGLVAAIALTFSVSNTQALNYSVKPVRMIYPVSTGSIAAHRPEPDIINVVHEYEGPKHD